ncbi:hypothetical protein [Actinomadura sp. NTSP31]|uniref:hypothetical protein n=1 Tax=Actinomadura sp. NTSP31 TaxID=1735447 RepID=UPI0035BEFC9A
MSDAAHADPDGRPRMGAGRRRRRRHLPGREERAPVAVFLASDGARYLTGNTLFVAGGSPVNGVAWTPDLDGEQ